MPFALCQRKREVEDFLDEIGPALAARAITLLALLAESGPKMPAHSKALGSGLFELKVDSRGRALRFFYMHWKGRIAILGCLDKKTQKTPDQVLAKVRARKRRIEEGEESLEQLAVH